MTKILLWIGLCVAVLLGVIWQLFPLPDGQQRVQSLPLVGIGYKGKELPLNAFEQDFFKNISVLKRVYTIGHQEISVIILDGTRHRHAVHDPFYCFTGSGWKIESQTPFPLQQGEGNLLEISKEGVKKQALFWFTDGTLRYASPIHYWVHSTLRRLTLGLSGEESLLVIVQPLDPLYPDWGVIKKHFALLFNL